MKNLRLFVFVMALVAGLSIGFANPTNTTEEFSETWENLAADSGGGGSATGAPQNGWGVSYNSYVRTGNIGGTGDRIYEFRDANGATIYRSDMQVEASAAGKFYVSFDYKYVYSADHYNFTAEFGQGSVGPDPYTLDSPKIRFWIYGSDVSGSTSAGLYNQYDGGSDLLYALENGKAYNIQSVIDINSDTHVVTITDNSTDEVVYTSSALTLYGDWADVALTSTAFRKGQTNASGGLSYVDNILVTSVPEPATMCILFGGAAVAVLRRRK